MQIGNIVVVQVREPAPLGRIPERVLQDTGRISRDTESFCPGFGHGCDDVRGIAVGAIGNVSILDHQVETVRTGARYDESQNLIDASGSIFGVEGDLEFAVSDGLDLVNDNGVHVMIRPLLHIFEVHSKLGISHVSIAVVGYLINVEINDLVGGTIGAGLKAGYVKAVAVMGQGAFLGTRGIDLLASADRFADGYDSNLFSAHIYIDIGNGAGKSHSVGVDIAQAFLLRKNSFSIIGQGGSVVAPLLGGFFRAKAPNLTEVGHVFGTAHKIVDRSTLPYKP